MKPRASTVGLCVAASLGAGLGCGGTSVSVQPDGKALSSSITTIVELPVFLGYGLPGEQRRVQRRTGDALIALAGGHAVLAEELPLREDRDLTDQEIAQAVRAAGEDPAQAITFSIVASRTKRSVANSSPIPGFQMGRRMVLDYTVRLEVRQAGRADVIGTVDSVVASFPNEPEIGSRGESLGVQKAIEDAVARAARTFAPGLICHDAAPFIAEVPAAVAGKPLQRLQALQDLYPELSIDQLQVLATSSERLMVIRPGNMAPLGLSPGDLLAPPSGQTLSSRAALARNLARGQALKLVVARGGQRYLLVDRGRAALAAVAPSAGPVGSLAAQADAPPAH